MLFSHFSIFGVLHNQSKRYPIILYNIRQQPDAVSGVRLLQDELQTALDIRGMQNFVCLVAGRLSEELLVEHLNR